MNNRYTELLIVVLFFISSISCSDDCNYVNKDALSSQEVEVELFTNASLFEKPIITKSKADEDLIDPTPWVLVFRGNDDSSVFFEAVQATVINNKSFVKLTKTNESSRLLVISNPLEQFYNGSTSLNFNADNLSRELAGKTFNEVVNTVLLTPLLNTPLQSNVPFTPNIPLPMSNVLSLNKIDGSASIGTVENKFVLSRGVAKVVVKNSDPNFNLQGVALVNAPRNGRFYQLGTNLKNNIGNQTDYLTTLVGDGVSGISGANGVDNYDNPIYVYDSKANENTSVIVKGIYNGEEYYYRIVFNDINNVLLDIKRNHLYEFIIKSISGPGYTTISEAKSAPSSNIKAVISVTDLNAFDIIDNEQYYLGLSNSECIIYGDQVAETNLLVGVITTNAPSSALQTHNIILNSVPENSMTNWGSPQIGTGGILATTYIRINLSASFVSGTVTLKLGNIIKIIPVSRRPALASSGGSLEFANYVSGSIVSQGTGGESWLTLSEISGMTGSAEIDRLDEGSIFLNISSSGGIKREKGEVYLVKNSNEGRVKLLLSQN